MRDLSRLLRDFGGDARGSFAVAGAIAAPVLALAIGYGIDTAQLFQVRSNLQNALDAAVTSTARDLTTGRIKEKDARERVEAFLQANASLTLADAATVTLGNLVVDRVAKTVDAEAFVEARVFFPLFGSSDQRKLGANSSALYSDKKVEVVMMLDTTGSMGEKNKLEDLKTAATNAVDGLLNNADPANPRVRVSVVPYAASVNAGVLAAHAVFPEFKAGDVLPAGISRDLPLPLVSAVSTGLAALVAKNSTDTCATERKLANGEADPSADGPDAVRYFAAGNYKYPARVNRDDRLPEHACPAASIVPLTADKDALKAEIESFAAAGSTAGAIALQWGYYMLSPEWRNTIKDAKLGVGPADYNGKKTSKIAVLMTDGLFNTAFTGGDLTETKGLADRAPKARANAEALCKAMKAKGIELYTVGFALPTDEKNDARKVLAGCASEDMAVAPKHFFDAANGEELDGALQQIIANIERLAVTR